MERIEVIGRKREQQELGMIIQEKEASFVVVYGRRRVGKTFLINSFFKDDYAFKCTGLSKRNKQDQLLNFATSLNRYSKGEAYATPTSWYEAFENLRTLLEAKHTEGKKVVFIDEMPWMDTPRSNFIVALEHFWNEWGCTQTDLVFIVCGSATSWITKKILRNHGGLHNRATHRLYLHPFTLGETRDYLASRGLELSIKDVVECYMVMGGVPYYLKQLQRGKSVAQNIDEMFFQKNGRLDGEYEELYASLYSNPEPYLKVVETLGMKNKGLTREELLQFSRLTDNGHLNEVLDNLISCDMIRSYQGYGKQSKSRMYQLLDPFTLFHLRFIREYQKSEKSFWTNQMGKSAYNTWCGLSFERLCLLHHLQIEKALQIAGIQTQVYSWTTSPQSEEKAQIDLIINRADRVMNVCEMKYSMDEYAFSKKEAEHLQRRVSLFRQQCQVRSAIHPVLVTTYGLRQNAYSSVVQNVVTMNQLFD